MYWRRDRELFVSGVRRGETLHNLVWYYVPIVPVNEEVESGVQDQPRTYRNSVPVSGGQSLRVV